jgi:hypothetical protein
LAAVGRILVRRVADPPTSAETSRSGLVVDPQGSSVSQPRVVRIDDGAIVCGCGDRLADHIDGWKVVIDGVEFQFRRRTDVMVCRSCGFPHPALDLWAAAAPPLRADTGERRRRDD